MFTYLITKLLIEVGRYKSALSFLYIPNYIILADTRAPHGQIGNAQVITGNFNKSRPTSENYSARTADVSVSTACGKRYSMHTKTLF